MKHPSVSPHPLHLNQELCLDPARAFALALPARTAEGVDLVDKDDARGFLPGHLEQLLHQPLTLSLPLRHKVGRRRCHEGRIVRLGRHRLAMGSGGRGGQRWTAGMRDEMHEECQVNRFNLAVVHHRVVACAHHRGTWRIPLWQRPTPAEQEEPANRLIKTGTEALGDDQRVGA